MTQSSVFEQFVTLWIVIDPIGTIPVFIAVTASFSAAQQMRIAIFAALAAATILLAFLIAGQFLLEALGIGLESFAIAGGIVLFLFALILIFGPSKPETEKNLAPGEHGSIAIYPLAIPSLASPGAMLAVVLLTDKARFSFSEQLTTAVIMLTVMGVALLFMLAARVISRFIGPAGAAIVSRVMGMILAAVAVDSILTAIIALARQQTA
jgi:multiple antibiotic resistance protein